MTGKELMGPDGFPIKVMEEIKDIRKAKQIWKGPPKIGKTSTAAALKQASDKYGLGLRPFFILCEPGSEGVELECTSQQCPACGGKGKKGKSKCEDCKGSGVSRLVMSTREELRSWFSWASENPVNPVVIDTGDKLYQVISDDVCREMNILSPYGAQDHGLTWAIIRDEMRELLALLDEKGVILIHHIYMKQKATKGGVIEQAVFNVPGQAKNDLAGYVDQILHFDIMPNDDGEGDKHVLIAAQRAGIEAGDRWGLFPEELSLGESAEEAAENILVTFGELEE